MLALHTIRFNWFHYENLTSDLLYRILKARQQVFVVEQNCAYLDIDDLDRHCHHLLAEGDINGKQEIAGYLRIIFPGKKYAESAIGRLFTTAPARSIGLGKELMSHALQLIDKEYPGQTVRISAQLYLEKFYQSFDFFRTSGPYDEDGITHIEMIRLPIGMNETENG